MQFFTSTLSLFEKLFYLKHPAFLKERKFKLWLERYAPAEIAGTITAVLGASIVYHVTKNPVLAALFGTWCENIGFYGVIITQDIRQSRHEHKARGLVYTRGAFAVNIRNIFLEFGVAEILDSFVVRPFWMYFMPFAVGNFELGIFLGKIAADLTFYIPTILAYEMRKKIIPEFKN